MFIDNNNPNAIGNPNINGDNGLVGHKKWECYMLLKYGYPNQFNIAGDYEYLIELPIYPESVTETIQPNWQQTNVLGRSSPLAAYGYTGLKDVSFSMTLHRDLLTGSYSLDDSTFKSMGGKPINNIAGNQLETENNSRGPFWTRRWYLKINKMLQMSCYPQYTEKGLIPPTTYFIFGQMILKGFVTSYHSTWKLPIENTFYSNNTVEISMNCYPDSIISARDFLNGRGADSTQNTYNTAFPDNSAVNSNIMTRYSGSTNSRTSSSLGGNPIET